jgi:hypothetical protein
LPSKPEHKEVGQKTEMSTEVISWIENVIVPALVGRFLREKNPMLKEKD